MVPDFQTLMRPVLNAAKDGEVHIGDVVELLATEFELSEDDKNELLPSGMQTRFANRVHWARSYLKQAGLLRNVRRSYFEITKTGLEALASKNPINRKYLEQFPKFVEFQSRSKTPSDNKADPNFQPASQTPDEALRLAYQGITETLAADILDRVQEADPEFFEHLIVDLLIKMGYGAGEETGHVLGQSGDNGVDGVINQDALGVDQVFVQAKRYATSNTIGSGAIRDFFGALAMQDVNKGIFVTTSSFTANAKDTAKKLGARIVLIDGFQLARLMIKFEVGCRVEQVINLAKLDESYFE